MPINKNAMTRYKILDELLSNKYHDYSLNDLTEEVNRRLDDMGIMPVTRRCIEKDIAYIEHEGPFMADIDRYFVPIYDNEKQKSTNKMCLKYTQPSYSIFKKPMSDDEKYLLSEALSLLGQFDGLPNLDALERLRIELGVSKERKIISFTKNPLENKNLIGALFSAISNKQVISITYKLFGKTNVEKEIFLYPYLLKEYNRRWYLVASAETDNKLLCYSLDRINKVIPHPNHKYMECKENLDEYFEDIIGITRYANKNIDHITFWVSDKSKDYVITKPLHDSQIHYRGTKETSLKEKYPELQGGAFFSIDCIENYELIRELCCFGEDLLVLSPIHIQNEVYEKCLRITERYLSIRNKK